MYFKHYKIDFEKVKTLEDVIRILKAADFSFEPYDKGLLNIKDLIHSEPIDEGLLHMKDITYGVDNNIGDNNDYVMD